MILLHAFICVSATIPATQCFLTSATPSHPTLSRNQGSPGQTHCITAVAMNNALKIPRLSVSRLYALTVIRRPVEKDPDKRSIPPAFRRSADSAQRQFDWFVQLGSFRAGASSCTLWLQPSKVLIIGLLRKNQQGSLDLLVMHTDARKVTSTAFACTRAARQTGGSLAMFAHKVVLDGFRATGKQRGDKQSVHRCARYTCARALSSSNLSLMRSNYLTNTIMYLESVNRIKSELKS